MVLSRRTRVENGIAITSDRAAHKAHDFGVFFGDKIGQEHWLEYGNEPRQRRVGAAAMSNRGSITLGELEGKLTMLEAACHRCDRKGRINLARLIDEHGPDRGLPDFWESLARDRQQARSTALHNRCAIYYPQLPALFLTDKGSLMPPAGAFNEQGFGNDCLLIERRTAGDAKMGLSHGPQFDQQRRSAIGQASPLRHLAHRHGRNLLGGLAVAIMVFAAAISMVTG